MSQVLLSWNLFGLSTRDVPGMCITLLNLFNCFKVLSKPDRQSLQSRAGYRVEQVDLPHLRAIAEPLRLSKESGMGCSKMCRLLVQLGARIARHALHMLCTCKLCQCKASQLRTQSGFKFRFFTRPEGKESLRAISQGKRRRGQDSAGLR